MGYNLRIMRKILGFWRWIAAACIFVGAIALVVAKQHAAAEEYKADRERYCAAFSHSEEQRVGCTEENASAKDYLPWWYILVSWPEGITVWAIIGTGFVIAWQSHETRRSANAALQSVKLEREEFISTFRPRIRVRLIVLEERGGKTKISLNIVNVGDTEAHVTEGDAVLTHNFSTFDDNVVINGEKISPRTLKAGESVIHQIDLGEIGSTTARMVTQEHSANGTFECKGIIRYRDGNGTTRITEWRREYCPQWREFLPFDRRGSSPYDYED